MGSADCGIRPYGCLTDAFRRSVWATEVEESPHNAALQASGRWKVDGGDGVVRRLCMHVILLTGFRRPAWRWESSRTAETSEERI